MLRGEGQTATLRGPGSSRPRCPKAPKRLALYSHDTQGLGHVRRNSLLAAALVNRNADLDVLLLTGAPEAAALPLPRRTSVVTLPALAKDRHGGYASRSLSLPLQDTIAMRSDLLRAALSSFDPDLLIVDKVARGILGELEPALRVLRSRGRSRTVLGLRDVLDDAATTQREWEESRSTSAVAQLYDRVWVYGDPRVFDPAIEYGWDPLVRQKVDYTGYLARGRRDLTASASRRSSSNTGSRMSGPFVLCLVGGGQDGETLLRAFAGAEMPPGHTGVLVTGPYLDPAARRELSAAVGQRQDLVVVDFVSDLLDLVGEAAAMVSMAGYNSACELLESRRPVLLVPRTVPRQEQAIRAGRLHEAGAVDVLDMAALTPPGISEWLAGAVVRPERDPLLALDLDGFRRVGELAEPLLWGHPADVTRKEEHVAV